MRADKQDSVWDALGWEPPFPWSALRAMMGTKSGRGGSEQKPQQDKHQQGGPGRSRPDPGPLGLIDEMDDEGFVIDDDIEDAVKALLNPSGLLGELAQEDAEALHLPGWDEIPPRLAVGYSPRLAGMLGQGRPAASPRAPSSTTARRRRTSTAWGNCPAAPARASSRTPASAPRCRIYG